MTKAQELAKCRAKLKAYEKRFDELGEVLVPFAFHARALGVQKRNDMATVVSQKDSSYLCIGAFKFLLEEMDPKDLRILRRK